MSIYRIFLYSQPYSYGSKLFNCQLNYILTNYSHVALACFDIKYSEIYNFGKADNPEAKVMVDISGIPSYLCTKFCSKQYVFTIFTVKSSDTSRKRWRIRHLLKVVRDIYQKSFTECSDKSLNVKLLLY